APTESKVYRRAGTSLEESASKPKKRAPDHQRRPDALLVFDTETTIDASQALIAGVHRYYRVEGWEEETPHLTCVEEGIFLGDDDVLADPAATRLVERYVANAKGPAGDAHDARSSLRLLTRSQFVRHVLLGAIAAKATVVGFNLPFDLSRIAIDWGIAE